MTAARYALAAERVPSLIRRWVFVGLLYGVIVFVVMTFVVQPLSAAPKGAHVSMRGLMLNSLAMLAFGLIVAATTRQAFMNRRQVCAVLNRTGRGEARVA